MRAGLRLDAGGTIRHVMVHGSDARVIFRDDRDREDLLAVLAALARNRHLTVYAWALMSNHFHLLLKAGVAPLDASMKSLFVDFSAAVSRRDELASERLLDGYDSTVCEDSRYFLELEEDGKIHLDAFLYRNGERKLEAMRVARDGVWLEGTGAHPFAFELDLATGACRERKVSDRPGEWPRIDERLVGHKNRWGYAIEAERDYLILANSPLRVLKYDRQGGGAVRHDFGHGLFPAEPVFVPRRGGTDEDDGYVLTVVYDGPRDASFLAILDAKNLGDPPLAKLHLRQRMPAGFHGSWAEGVV